MNCKTIPITLKQANSFVTANHRHHSSVAGCKFALGLTNADKFDSVGTDFGGRAYWGRIQSDGEIFINKTVLEHQLEEIGFNFTALKKKWAEVGHLKKTPQGRFSNVYSINGVRANYVILVIKVEEVS